MTFAVSGTSAVPDCVLSSEEAAAVAEWSARLADDNPVRRIASQTLAGWPVSMIQPLIASLLNRDRRRRQEKDLSILLLGRLARSEEETYAASVVLSAVLADNPREQLIPRLVRAAGWAFLIAVLASPLLTATDRMLRANMPHGMDLTALNSQQALAAVKAMEERARSISEHAGHVIQALLVTTMALGGLASWFDDRRRYGRQNRVRSSAARALGMLGRPEGVEALIAGLSDRDRAVRDACSAALKSALPALRDRHLGTLDESVLVAMGRGVSPADASLSEALVEALERVDTGHSLPYLERAARSAPGPVQSAAAKALDTVRKRANLLRAADAHPDDQRSAGGQLLRPLSHVEEAPQLLVRSANNPDE